MAIPWAELKQAYPRVSGAGRTLGRLCRRGSGRLGRRRGARRARLGLLGRRRGRGRRRLARPLGAHLRPPRARAPQLSARLPPPAPRMRILAAQLRIPSVRTGASRAPAPQVSPRTLHAVPRTLACLRTPQFRPAPRSPVQPGARQHALCDPVAAPRGCPAARAQRACRAACSSAGACSMGPWQACLLLEILAGRAAPAPPVRARPPPRPHRRPLQSARAHKSASGHPRSSRDRFEHPQAAPCAYWHAPERRGGRLQQRKCST